MSSNEDSFRERLIDANPWNAPEDTFQKVRNAFDQRNPAVAAKLLDESMAQYKKEYESAGKDWHTLDGSSETWAYTHNYLPMLARMLQKEGKTVMSSGKLQETGILPDLAPAWLRQHSKIDTGHDGYINIDELKAARAGNRDKVQQAFLDHLINNYDRLSDGDSGIRVRSVQRKPAADCHHQEQELARLQSRLDSWQLLAQRTQQNEALLQERHRIEVRPGDTYRSLALRLTAGNRHDAVYEESKLRRLNSISEREFHPGLKLRTRSDWEIAQEAKRSLQD